MAYRTRDVTLNRLVARKVLPDTTAMDAETPGVLLGLDEARELGRTAFRPVALTTETSILLSDHIHTTT